MPTEADSQKESDSAEQPSGRGVTQPEEVRDHGLTCTRRDQEGSSQASRSSVPPDVASSPEDRVTYNRTQQPQRDVANRDWGP